MSRARALLNLLTLAPALTGLSCSAATAGDALSPMSRTPPATATAAGSPTAGRASTSASGSSVDDAVTMVLAISVDGLSTRAIRDLGPKKTPALHRMMAEGAGTLNARTEREQTRTLPNHTGMLTGRRIEAARGGHGITYNTDRGSTVHKAAGRYVPSVFDVVHDRGGRTALFAAKTKFRTFDRSWNTSGAPDLVGRDHGKAKIDRVRIDANNLRLVNSVRAELQRSPRSFTFLHLSLPDAAGHEDGFTSPQYRRAVQQADARVGRVLRTIAARPALRDHLLVVLTADHGGVSGKSHSDETRLDNYRVPFLVWGPGVARGADLYALNPQRRDPGTARTSYSGRQPVRNGDVANLVTDVLDRPAVGGSELNRKQDLLVFPR